MTFPTPEEQVFRHSNSQRGGHKKEKKKISDPSPPLLHTAAAAHSLMNIYTAHTLIEPDLTSAILHRW